MLGYVMGALETSLSPINERTGTWWTMRGYVPCKKLCCCLCKQNPFWECHPINLAIKQTSKKLLVTQQTTSNYWCLKHNQLIKISFQISHCLLYWLKFKVKKIRKAFFEATIQQMLSSSFSLPISTNTTNTHSIKSLQLSSHFFPT